MSPGAEDVVRAASGLSSRLPWPLGVLARLAYNYRWAWLPGGPDVFRDVDPDRWRACAGNPVRLLQETSAEALLRAASDASLVARAEQLELALLADLARPTATGAATEARPIAFFCAEYGVHASLPIYAGGLGALAGDIVKEASDRALPFVAVGLMYRHGYFRQRIDHSGWQQEFWVPTDPERSPAVLVTAGEDRAPLRITVPIGVDEVAVAALARRRRPRAAAAARHRPARERARRALDHLAAVRRRPRAPAWRSTCCSAPAAPRRCARSRIEPGVVHMNEGHAAFAAVEMTRARGRGGGGLRDRLRGGPPPHGLHDAHARPGGQRHVPRRRGARGRSAARRVAGHERRRGHSPRAHASRRRRRGLRRHAVRAARQPRGQRRQPAPRRGGARDVAGTVARPARPTRCRSPMSPTASTSPRGSARRCARCSIAISARAGSCARPTRPRSPPSTRSRPPSCGRCAASSAGCSSSTSATAASCTGSRAAIRATTSRPPRRRSIPTSSRWASRGGWRPTSACTCCCTTSQRSMALLRGERPVQLLIAGKAHPRDDDGKRLVQQLFAVRAEAARVRARRLPGGLRPRRRGASRARLRRLAQRAAAAAGGERHERHEVGRQRRAADQRARRLVGGGLRRRQRLGAAGRGRRRPPRPGRPSRRVELYGLLEREVVPEFYARDDAGIPQAWIERVKRSMRTLIPAFSATRMLAEYESRVYRGA